MPASLSPVAAFSTPALAPGIPPTDTLTVDPGLSPILNRSPHPLPIPQSPRPEFAELLTPNKLRRKRRHGVPQVVLPDSVAGPSTGGWQTGQGDVYRGATLDPTVTTVTGDAKAELDEDALTFESSSSGSTWSIVSDLERGRRRTVAALERLRERIGVRRGSDSSSNSSLTSSRLDRPHELRHQGSRRQISMAGRITRTLTRRSSMDSTPDGPRREYIPRKREFVLLLPEGEGDGDRVISTPSLQTILDAIKALRVRNGLLLESANPTPAPSRGGSGRGYPRRPVAKRSQTSFAHPAVPLRLHSGTNTPTPSPLGLVQPLTFSAAAAAAATKPKSVSDLLHLPSNASAPNLTRLLASFPSNPVPTPGLAKPQGSWWLDVSCPTWEDLRDVGELLSLHPLTLEDVLQQDPREKLDMFDKLGYYFVVVRALDETYFKYTPGTGSVSSIGKNPSGTPSPAMSGDTLKDEKIGNGPLGGSPELVSQNEKKKESQRRGWGMGRAVGKLAGRNGEKVEIVEDNPGREGLEGVGVGAVNVYLAVFEDGVVSFHYDDISKHTTKVRDRILSLAGGAGSEHTSDWVAHGLIDSIVDAFFPLIRYVDGEVDDIDSLTIDPSVDPKAAIVRQETQQSTSTLSSATPPTPPSCPVDNEKMDEKGSPSPSPPLGPHTKSELPITITTSKMPLRKRLRSCLPRLPRLGNTAFTSPLPNLFPSRVRRTLHQLIYLRLFFLPTSSAARKRNKASEPLVDRGVMLRRITDLRRLVTGLTRLLGTKHQVIGRMRKHAGKDLGGRGGKGIKGDRAGGDVWEGGSAVEAYIGDVEDHILLLQTSLMHYEYILSHCQPAYLSHLQVSFLSTRGGISKQILTLSVVTITILPLQLVTGLLGMNVRVPRDGDQDHLDENGDPAGFTTFGVTIAIVFVIICAMVMLVRWWRWTARRKFAQRRGVEVPAGWDGYWGWK